MQKVNKKIKVLTIINSLNLGGIEKTMLSGLNYIDDSQIEMLYCCFSKGGALEEEYKSKGAKILYIKKTGLILLDFLQLLAIIFKNNIDLVHSRFAFTSGGFVLASKALRRKMIVSIHSTSPTSFRKFKKYLFIYRLLQLQLKVHRYLTLRYADKIIGHSTANLNAFLEKWKDDERFILLYNGIDFENLERQPKEDSNLADFVKNSHFVFLHIGSFRLPKNHFFLLKVFKSLLQDYPNSKLILVGDGELLEKAISLSKDLGIAKWVKFVGNDNEIRKYFTYSDLFIFPSLYEGFGNVVLEAQYFGIPVIASKIPALMESSFIDYQKYFFDPTDENEAAQNIKKILNDLKSHQLEDTIKKAKKHTEENFAVENMMQELSNIYIKSIEVNQPQL